MQPKRRKKPVSVSEIIALVFLGIIILGTLLLCLPAASRSGQSCGLRVSLFTATSASCVTGLVLADTWTQWSPFGQAVILGLIETGGLGFMSAASLIIFSLRKKISMHQQMLIAQSMGIGDMSEVIRIQRNILVGSLSVEAAGALILTMRFTPIYGLKKAWKLGVFHSISAFCNAGFDILGFDSPGSSMILFGKDPVVLLTLSALIVIGGLGFWVWDEILRNPKRLSVYARLVLRTSAALLVTGTVLICLLEWDNPATLGKLGFGQKLLAAFFQSVTTRTAGFAGIDQAALTDAGKAVTMFLMLIGGSSGSTAGGLKTVTFIVLVLFLWSRVRGRSTVTVFHRTIPDKHVLDAVTIFGAMAALAFFGAALICATSPVSFTNGLYESISALATVGLTAGATPLLSVPAQLLMILFMYLGRVGILTVSLGFLEERKDSLDFKYADTTLLIG